MKEKGRSNEDLGKEGKGKGNKGIMRNNEEIEFQEAGGERDRDRE